MASERTPLFVRLPRHQAAALDRLSEATGRHKQHLVSELLGLLGQGWTSDAQPLSLGRVELTTTPEVRADEVLTLDEVAELLKLPGDAVRSRAEKGEFPGRRFGKEWRFSRMAVLAWLADGDTQQRASATSAPRAVD